MRLIEKTKTPTMQVSLYRERAVEPFYVGSVRKVAGKWLSWSAGSFKTEAEARAMFRRLVAA